MKKGDIIVIFTLIIIFCFSFVYINKSFITTEDKYISVQVNGEEIEVPASEYDRLKRALDMKGYVLGGF